MGETIEQTRSIACSVEDVRARRLVSCPHSWIDQSRCTTILAPVYPTLLPPPRAHTTTTMAQNSGAAPSPAPPRPGPANQAPITRLAATTPPWCMPIETSTPRRPPAASR